MDTTGGLFLFEISFRNAPLLLYLPWGYPRVPERRSFQSGNFLGMCFFPNSKYQAKLQALRNVLMNFESWPFVNVFE